MGILNAAEIAVGGGAVVRHPVVEFLGDSISDQATELSATEARFDAVGFPSWVRTLTGGRVTIDLANVLGVAGATTTTMVSDQLPIALVSTAKVSVIHIATNDIKGGSISLATTKDNIAGAVTALVNVGKQVILVPVLPRTGAVTFSTAQSRQAASLRRWMYETYGRLNNRVFIADAVPTFTDASTGNGASSTYFQDGLHTAPKGAYYLAAPVADVLNTLYPLSDELLCSTLDSYHIIDNPTGDLSGLGIMAGTGGTLFNGATGTAPSTYLAQLSASSPTLSAAFSIVDHPTIVGLKRTKVTLGGSGDTRYASLRRAAAITLPAEFVAGDQIVFECEATVTGLVDVNSVFVQLIETGTNKAVYDMFSTADKGVFPTITKTLTFRTPPLVLPVGFGGIYHDMIVRPMTSGSPSGTVEWSRPSVRKVV